MAEISLHEPVNRAADPNRLSDLERVHVPVVIGDDVTGHSGFLPDMLRRQFPPVLQIDPGLYPSLGFGYQHCVQIAVWIDHEMTEDHYVRAIAVGDGERDLFRAHLTPNSDPHMNFTIRVTESKTLKVHACCNRHGCWETDFPVIVEYNVWRM